MLEKDMTEFLVSDYVTTAQARLVREQLLELVTQVRPNAVPLVDAFALPDYNLASALGRYDGNAYEALVEFVEKEPLNQTVVIDSHENIKPFVYAGLKRQKEESKL